MLHHNGVVLHTILKSMKYKTIQCELYAVQGKRAQEGVLQLMWTVSV